MSTEKIHTLRRLDAADLRRLRIAGMVALLTATGVAVAGIVIRKSGEHDVKAWTLAQAAPAVTTVQPQTADADDVLALPGRLEAFNEAPLFARVSGYVKRWNYDIGSHVKAGAVLAEIDAPDLDQQLAQARADLASATSHYQLADVTARRWDNLRKQDAVSQQDMDEKAGSFAAQKSAVDAARANVDRLQALASFKKIVAPFDGVVTARRTDVGSLVNAGGVGGPELFRVADLHRLRVYVEVPQNYLPALQSGARADLSVPERPGTAFPATMVANSQAVSRGTGTLLVELQVDNTDGRLVAGEYAEVHLRVRGAAVHALRIPASALIFRDKGLQVATLGNDGRVAMKPVTLAHDSGTYVDVSSGLSPQDRVIDSPPDSLAQGDQVRATAPVQGAGHGQG
ncbi:MAG TPA: efflux RND transporter periplasmic adaptor subunit [Moraxellaceae bacterium]|nr:efflux RND transporter periplasmic adaptor subunit [Moraxellaceae bacterium]